nr:hypothetical protein [uncultured Eisenbergiella sp.]
MYHQAGVRRVPIPRSRFYLLERGRKLPAHEYEKAKGKQISRAGGVAPTKNRAAIAGRPSRVTISKSGQ